MSQISILLVEDELIAAESLVFDLQCRNYQVVGVATSGEKAITLVNQKQPDIILMDIKIRGQLDGIQTAKQIQNQYSIPIIYLSAFSDKETFARIENETKKYLHLTKPIKFQELQKLITQITSGKEPQ